MFILCKKKLKCVIKIDVCVSILKENVIENKGNGNQIK